MSASRHRPSTACASPYCLRLSVIRKMINYNYPQTAFNTLKTFHTDAINMLLCTKVAYAKLMYRVSRNDRLTPLRMRIVGNVPNTLDDPRDVRTEQTTSQIACTGKISCFLLHATMLRISESAISF